MCFVAQKNRLSETVLLSSRNICFGKEIRKLRGTCIKGLFWPPLEPKTESCFHQFHLIGLLVE